MKKFCFIRVCRIPASNHVCIFHCCLNLSDVLSVHCDRECVSFTCSSQIYISFPHDSTLFSVLSLQPFITLYLHFSSNLVSIPILDGLLLCFTPLTDHSISYCFTSFHAIPPLSIFCIPAFLFVYILNQPLIKHPTHVFHRSCFECIPLRLYSISHTLSLSLSLSFPYISLFHFLRIISVTIFLSSLTLKSFYSFHIPLLYFVLLRRHFSRSLSHFPGRSACTPSKLCAVLSARPGKQGCQ